MSADPDSHRADAELESIDWRRGRITAASWVADPDTGDCVTENGDPWQPRPLTPAELASLNRWLAVELRDDARERQEDAHAGYP